MSVNFDADICGLRLPVELCVGNIEEIPRSDNFFRWYAHQSDLCGIATDFWSPETE